LNAEFFVEPWRELPVKPRGKLGQALGCLRKLVLDQRRQHQQQGEYQNQSDQHHQQRSDGSRHPLAFHPAHGRLADVGQHAADEKRGQDRSEPMQQCRDRDQRADHPQVVLRA